MKSIQLLLMLCIYLGEDFPMGMKHSNSTTNLKANLKWLKDNGYITVKDNIYMLTPRGMKQLERCISPMGLQRVYIVDSRDQGVVNAYYDKDSAQEARIKQGVFEEMHGGRPNISLIEKIIL